MPQADSKTQDSGPSLTKLVEQESKKALDEFLGELDKIKKEFALAGTKEAREAAISRLKAAYYQYYMTLDVIREEMINVIRE